MVLRFHSGCKTVSYRIRGDHGVQQFFSNGKPQTGAARLGIVDPILLGKGLKQKLLKFRAYSGSLIGNLYSVSYPAVRKKSGDIPISDFTVFRRVFYGV